MRYFRGDADCYWFICCTFLFELKLKRLSSLFVSALRSFLLSEPSLETPILFDAELLSVPLEVSFCKVRCDATPFTVVFFYAEAELKLLRGEALLLRLVFELVFVVVVWNFCIVSPFYVVSMVVVVLVTVV